MYSFVSFNFLSTSMNSLLGSTFLFKTFPQLKSTDFKYFLLVSVLLSTAMSNLLEYFAKSFSKNEGGAPD